MLKYITIFVICNYMKEVLDINIYKVHANYKSLFTERQCYIFMSLAQGTYTIAAGETLLILWARYDVDKHGSQRERQCQESCTNYSPTSSFSRDE